jgi:hypothetical protein
VWWPKAWKVWAMASSTSSSLSRKRTHLLDQQTDLQCQGAGPTLHCNAVAGGALECSNLLRSHMPLAGSLEEGRKGSRIGGSDQSCSGIDIQER